MKPQVRLALPRPYDGPLPLAPVSPVPRLRRIALAGNSLIAIFVFGLGIWSVYAPLESAAIAAGVVESESKLRAVQHLEGGIVRTLLVRDGDHVERGQPLLRLDDTAARTHVQMLRAQYWDAEAREARLLAERDGYQFISFPQALMDAADADPAVFSIADGQQAVFQSRRQMMQSQIAVIHERASQVEKEVEALLAQQAAAEQRSEIVRAEMATVERLVRQGLTPRPRLLELQREMVEVEGLRRQAAAQISRSYQVIAETKASLLTLQTDWENEVTESLYDVQTLKMQLAEKIQVANDRLHRSQVTAPDDGIVTNLKVHTEGEVISAGSHLMDIVPKDDRLIISARLRPEDIDVVRPGLEAEVQILAYKQRRARPLKGTVTYVSADHLTDGSSPEPYYAMQVGVKNEEAAQGEEVELIPGMPAQVFVKTGESTVALYALGPLLDSLDRSFRED